MHTCLLLTIRLSLLCAAMSIIYIACVTFILLQTRDESGKQVDHFFFSLFLLSTIQLVIANDTALLLPFLNWSTKEGQDYVERDIYCMLRENKTE